MCLTELCPIEAPDTGFGWKFFNKEQCGFATPFCGYEVFQEDEWIKALRVTPIHAECGDYESGFHVFPTKEAAEEWWYQPDYAKLRQVEYRGIVATGKQDKHPCLVVKEVRIVSVHQETTQEKASD